MHSLKPVSGRFIGNKFISVLTYADDIVVAARSAAAMRKLLRDCDVYAPEYDTFSYTSAPLSQSV